MDWKKLGKKLLFPHIVLMIVLVPISITMLVYSMVFVGTESAVAIISYVLSAYTLTVWCFKIPYLIHFFRAFKNENKFVRRWQNDDRLRVNISLFSSLIWNAAYAVFQLWLGIYHKTFWFASLGGYYVCLAIMRFFLVKYTASHGPGERMRTELRKYRACGIVLLLMNLALTLIVFFMVYWNRSFKHHEITTIAMAAYTFTTFTTAIANVIRYRKYNSPVYSASKVISFAAACVSMLTLESTMLTTWGAGEGDGFRRIMLALTGAAVTFFVLAMAIYMIIKSNKEIKAIDDVRSRSYKR